MKREDKNEENEKLFNFQYFISSNLNVARVRLKLFFFLSPLHLKDKMNIQNKMKRKIEKTFCTRFMDTQFGISLPFQTRRELKRGEEWRSISDKFVNETCRHASLCDEMKGESKFFFYWQREKK